jgi:hypothetical protein
MLGIGKLNYLSKNGLIVNEKMVKFWNSAVRMAGGAGRRSFERFERKGGLLVRLKEDQLVLFRRSEKKEGEESRVPWGLRKNYPFGFPETKAACLFNLSLEPFDLKSIQLFGSHIEKVEQFFYIDNAIDAFIINDHFMNALAHLLSSPTANPQMGQALAPLALIGIHQTVNDQGQNHMSPNGGACLLGILQ